VNHIVLDMEGRDCGLFEAFITIFFLRTEKKSHYKYKSGQEVSRPNLESQNVKWDDLSLRKHSVLWVQIINKYIKNCLFQVSIYV